MMIYKSIFRAGRHQLPLPLVGEGRDGVEAGRHQLPLPLAGEGRDGVEAGRRDGVIVATVFACSVFMSTLALAQVEEDPYKDLAEETEDPASKPEATAKAEGEPGEGKPDEGVKCFPRCRSGYLCHEGKCISMCNPPCERGEKCTVEGECVPKAAQAPPVVVAPVPSPPMQEISPQPDPFAVEEVAVEEEEELYVPVGIFVSLGFESSECASSGGCKTTPDGDFGLGGHVLSGYGILPKLVLEAGETFTGQILKSTDPDVLDPSGMFNVVRLGARFFPLGRQNVVEPVLGLHLGYFIWSTSWENNDGQGMKSTNHGISLDYALGLDFKLAERFSLGIVVTVYEPFFLTTCVDIDGGPTGAPDPATNQKEIVDPVSSCSKYNGKHDSFFFNTGIHAMMLF